MEGFYKYLYIRGTKGLNYEKFLFTPPAIEVNFFEMHESLLTGSDKLSTPVFGEEGTAGSVGDIFEGGLF